MDGIPITLRVCAFSCSRPSPSRSDFWRRCRFPVRCRPGGCGRGRSTGVEAYLLSRHSAGRSCRGSAAAPCRPWPACWRSSSPLSGPGKRRPLSSPGWGQTCRQIGSLTSGRGPASWRATLLIAVAVFTLKRRAAFDDAGQSELLVTGGVFSLMRHPIVSGMGLIYLGFFLVLPSPLVLGGLVSFAWHQQRRLAAEEVLLANRFGRHYRNYRRRVGRFWPCWPDRPEPS